MGLKKGSNEAANLLQKTMQEAQKSISKMTTARSQKTRLNSTNPALNGLIQNKNRLLGKLAKANKATTDHIWKQIYVAQAKIRKNMSTTTKTGGMI